jgi:hypothetical protein
MADPITAIAVIAGTAEAGKAYFQTQAAGAKEDALKLQAKQTQLQYQQKTISNLDMLDKITQEQIAQSTVRGYTIDSPSFNAMERESFNISSRMQKNLDVEESILERNNAIERANVKRTLYAQLFGDVLDVAKMGAEIYTKMPTME